MTDPRLGKKIDVILFSLVAMDVALSSLAFAFPQLWFQIFHGVPYSDPQGFLRRCGGNWTAFAVFQAIGLMRWRKKPSWLLIVAGLRFGDTFTDWSYFWFAQDLTTLGKALLLISSPGNLALGLFFKSSYEYRSGAAAPPIPNRSSHGEGRPV